MIQFDAEKASSTQHREYFAPPLLTSLLEDYDWEIFRNVWADKVFKTCFTVKTERNVIYLFCQTETGAWLQVTEEQFQQLTAAKMDGPDACFLLWEPPAHPKSLMERRFCLSDRSQFYRYKGSKNQWLKRETLWGSDVFITKRGWLPLTGGTTSPRL